MNADDRIRELVRANLLSDHQVELVPFVDELLLVAADVGNIKCSLGADALGLRFQTPDRPAWEVELSRANSKLRMICARLAVLCAGDADPPLYGGEGIITVDEKSALDGGANGTSPRVLKVELANRPGNVWFTLHAEKPSAKAVRESERVRA